MGYPSQTSHTLTKPHLEITIPTWVFTRITPQAETMEEKLAKTTKLVSYMCDMLQMQL